MSNLNKQFLNIELSKTLTELGFDEECLGVWDNQTKELFLNDTRELSIKELPTIFTLAPTHQQVFDWFICDFKLHGILLCDRDGMWSYVIKDILENERFTVGELNSDFQNTDKYFVRDKCIENLIFLTKKIN